MTNLRSLLFGRPQKVAPKTLLPMSYELDGRLVVINLKYHATAKRMVLRLSRDASSFALTLPKRQSVVSAKVFVATSEGWLRATLAKQATPVVVADAAEILLRGERHVIIATGKLRGLVKHDEPQKNLQIPGAAPHLKRKLIDWMKQQAEADLLKSSRHYAGVMQCEFTRLNVRDQKSRWGSCSTDKCLSYSWRLVMAPPMVLDYVAAHEVAHLLEMNHGPKFWRLVLTHCKHTREAKLWLKANGSTLHRFG